MEYEELQLNQADHANLRIKALELAIQPVPGRDHGHAEVKVRAIDYLEFLLTGEF